MIHSHKPHIIHGIFIFLIVFTFIAIGFITNPPDGFESVSGMAVIKSTGSSTGKQIWTYVPKGEGNLYTPYYGTKEKATEYFKKVYHIKEGWFIL